MKAPLEYIMRKTAIVQTYSDYPTYTTPNDEMIPMMLHILPEKNRLPSEQDAQSIRVHTAEYEIDNTSVYNILQGD